MDANNGRDIKKRKTSDKEGEDIISNLPNFIIGRILSFLPTKEAVRTRILSKRWIYLWTFITMLEFKDREQNSRKKFRKSDFQNFVYMVLRLITSTIETFSLTLSESHSSYHVNKWISDILKRGIKEFYILSDKEIKISWPTLLDTMSLEVLVLKMIACDIRVPTIVSLPYLRVLKLSGIRFTCNSRNDSEKVILNLPVLKKYEEENCSWLNVKGGVTFEVPLLEVLLIKHTIPVPKSDEWLTVIKFCAPRLNEFTYSDFRFRDTILLDLNLSPTRVIASANIQLFKCWRDSEESMVIFASEVLKQFNNNVRCLKLEVLKDNHDYNVHHISVPALTNLDDFGMLNRLELGEVTGEVLLDFLQKSPFLETLVVYKVVEFDEEFWNSDNVPFCLISNLQVLKCRVFDANEQELGFIKFVMENAQVLKRASFTTSLRTQAKYEKVKKKILSFKRSVRFEFFDFLMF